MDAFVIGATTVTIRQFQLCVDAIDYQTTVERPIDADPALKMPPEHHEPGSLAFPLRIGKNILSSTRQHSMR
ncbi:MAG: hypothetical protein ABJN26_16805 [Stappiaceae bacterium]